MLPRMEIVDRARPVDLVAPGHVRLRLDWGAGTAPGTLTRPDPAAAPYAAVIVEWEPAEAGMLTVGWAGGGVELAGLFDVGRGRAGLRIIDAAGTASEHTSRRHGRFATAPEAVALTLTGTHVAAWGRSPDGAWTAYGTVDLVGSVETRSPEWLAGLEVTLGWDGAGPSPAHSLTTGSFGQLGLRDLHLATTAEGDVVRDERGRVILTATHAGPGFFDTGHTGVWAFDPRDHSLEHLSQIWFRRPHESGVFGDHASHLVRDGDTWLLATSTWGDFTHDAVGVTLARTQADLLAGEHVLDTVDLPLPTDAVGTWDPHLLRISTDPEEWVVAYVAAKSFFDFHPGLCRGPSLSELRPVAEDRSKVATEGTVLVRVDDEWRLLASDGRDNDVGVRCRYPIHDLELREIGVLDAPYPSNLPWPMVWQEADGWRMITFDGTRAGGPALGYGTHGDVVVLREA